MRNEPEDQTLDALFAEARASTLPSDALMARVLADADAMAPTRSARRPISAWVDQLFGGWPVLSGAAMAGVAGLVFGIGLTAMNPDLSLNLQQASGLSTDVLIDFGDPWAFAALGDE